MSFFKGFKNFSELNVHQIYFETRYLVLRFSDKFIYFDQETS